MSPLKLTRSAVPRLPTHADLGIPEVWRETQKGLVVLLRQPDGTYEPSDASLAFPFVDLEEVRHWLDRAKTAQMTLEWRFEFQEWARQVLLPRYRALPAGDPEH